MQALKTMLYCAILCFISISSNLVILKSETANGCGEGPNGPEQISKVDWIAFSFLLRFPHHKIKEHKRQDINCKLLTFQTDATQLLFRANNACYCTVENLLQVRQWFQTGKTALRFLQAVCHSLHILCHRGTFDRLKHHTKQVQNALPSPKAHPEAAGATSGTNFRCLGWLLTHGDSVFGKRTSKMSWTCVGTANPWRCDETSPVDHPEL